MARGSTSLVSELRGHVFFSPMPPLSPIFFCPLLQTHGTMTVSFTEKDRENLPQAHWLGLLSSLYLKAQPVVSCLTPELLVEVKRCLSHWVALAPPEIPEGILSLRARELRGAPWGLATLKRNFLESSGLQQEATMGNGVGRGRTPLSLGFVCLCHCTDASDQTSAASYW